MCEETSEEVMIASALHAARKAFEETLSGVFLVDPGHYDIRITVWPKDVATGRRYKKFDYENELESDGSPLITYKE